ncbi:outer membrane receptor protein involved in Fe transport [Nonlabens xylanidelens]|uniref:Outer membrane receptor protein involved in Fe transport n=1 Tax=Nonlabens xylanidelens TaxID=191564 RepID=A0A2S6IGB1_9FLAO|nr:TonB-dependent receptor [Nonlabens xylanidelens]PPK93252.1 outer membrane receptor protein involved in Fe transport [Nonlabens xylanidelens]PQJ20923.1 TonB-dependent receptor [Nonlabens xylanidelens]
MKIIFSYSAFAKAVLFIAFFFSTQFIAAHTITGFIKDINGQPLKDVYVLNVKSGTHTHSNAKGFFTIDNVEQEEELRFSHIGYEASSIVVTNHKDILQITLSPSSLNLDAITISNDVETLNVLANVDLQINPVTSSQEILRTVPGLFIGQHAGGGKAEQIFLRGFDIDHGTDIAINVDGMPVNMVSHAHGQGYADLHFLIPETINNISYGVGNYDESVGNFATAGHVDFKTKSYLDESKISVEIGDFNHQRYLGLVQLVDNAHTTAYVATEYLTFDGPYDSPQNFDRINLFGKLHHTTDSGNRLSLSLSHFDSEWDASGQIPQRAVDSGLIDRFGSIDDTEGGSTSRTNVVLNYDMDISDKEQLETTMFYSHYDFLLYSNFTFFLEDPINGDQIQQQESRDLAGFKTKYSYETQLGANDLSLIAGFGLRNDRTDASGLSRTLNRRTTLENIQLGDINETNSSLFVGAELSVNKLLIDAGLRLERFKFVYKDALTETFDTQSQTATALLPKLNFNYEVSDNVKVYLHNGVGMHSNDTRVVLENGADDILPKSYGSDLGTVWKASDNLVVNGALWYLFLEQEFVYVGDAGIVEPSGETERYGFDLGVKYQLTDFLFLDTNLNYAHARAINEPDGADYIPLAPEFTSTGGISLKDYKRFNAGLRYRYIGDRAANEDNSIVAEGYFVADFNVNYDLTDNLRLGMAVQNLFDVEWNETQFATESRLASEAQSVEEIHFTPGTPFFLRGSIQYRF